MTSPGKKLGLTNSGTLIWKKQDAQTFFPAFLNKTPALMTPVYIHSLTWRSSSRECIKQRVMRIEQLKESC